MKRKSQNFELIFFPNEGFLGDKILYEPIVRFLNCIKKNQSIIGIEWSKDSISMMDYPLPPIASFVLPSTIKTNKKVISLFLRFLANLENHGFRTNIYYTREQESMSN